MKTPSLIFLLFALAGCATPPPPAEPALERAAELHQARVRVTLRIAIPIKRHRRPAFVSPATQSMTVTMTPAAGGAPLKRTVNLTPSSPGCISTPSSISCSVPLALTPGAYLADVSTFSATGGTGNLLSEGQQEPFTVVTGKDNVVALVLYGVPNSISVAPVTSQVGGSQGSGFTILGNLSQADFTIQALDAAGETIVGAGAPALSVHSSNADFGVTQPTSARPNRFAVGPPNVTSSELTKLTVSAQFADATVCLEQGAQCSAVVDLALAAFSTDDWSTFAHDPRLTGNQTQATGIATQTVDSLTRAWSSKTNSTVTASLLVYGGLVIAVSYGGTVYAFDAQTGATVWQTTLPMTLPSGAVAGFVKGTPAIDGSTVFVGDIYANNTIPFPPGYIDAPDYPSDVYALDLLTGHIRWTTRLPGIIRGQLLAFNGRLYAGTAGGDPLSCLQGGMQALDEATGAVVWSWVVSPIAANGGSSWSAVSFDGQHIIFGTGNTCTVPEPAADSAVALNLDGTVAWIFQPPDNQDNSDTENTGIDNDQAGGISYVSGQYYLENKSGNFYILNGNGSLQSTFTIAGRYTKATPTSDGHTTILADAGYIATPGDRRNMDYWISVPKGQPVRWLTPSGIHPMGTLNGKLLAFDLSGNPRWSVPSTNPMVAYASIVNGVAFAGISNAFNAYNLQTGQLLWSYALASGDYVLAGSVVVPSGVYAADVSGNVMAFRLPPSLRSRAHRALH